MVLADTVGYCALISSAILSFVIRQRTVKIREFRVEQHSPIDNEKNIIERLQNQFKEKDTSGNYIRRHDSVISFSKLHESQIEDVNSFEYLEQSGWFHKLDMEAVFADNEMSYELVEK